MVEGELVNAKEELTLVDDWAMFDDWDSPMIPSWEDILAAKKCRYEHAIVGHMLRRLDLMHLNGRIRSADKSLRNGRCLSLDPFLRVTDFPVWLAARKIRKVDQISARDLFQKFLRTKLYWELRDELHDTPEEFEDRPYGIVFPCRGVKFMVLHTWDALQSQSGTQFRFEQGPGAPVCVLEKLDDFLKAVQAFELPIKGRDENGH